MTSHALNATRPLARPSRAAMAAIGGSALAGMLVALAVLGLASSREPARPAAVFTAPGNAFKISVPAGWRATPAGELSSLRSRPAALLRRRDGRGTVAVRPAEAVRAGGPALVARLGSQLRRRFPGFQPVSARFVRIRGGRAFVYTFVHGRGRTVQTLALASVNGRSFAVDAVAPAGARQAAGEIGAIVASFGP